MKRTNKSGFLPPGKKKQTGEKQDFCDEEKIKSLEVLNKFYEDKLRQLQIVESNARKDSLGELERLTNKWKNVCLKAVEELEEWYKERNIPASHENLGLSEKLYEFIKNE
ncbi:DgyrCDS5423 [Dimorphilus gyrociliatus]|uniref:DgyrCDS5423 n=1 Tax=Dimorphilus gyrociliatus TaxID=2664684 RepID=A0A7I8VLH3_9ANNE|nr:DgyrCDS5423 [Dimorphilus gyrociliatus]